MSCSQQGMEQRKDIPWKMTQVESVSLKRKAVDLPTHSCLISHKKLWVMVDPTLEMSL